jgi:drug/metabolite transporter (DMT)-like permease
MKREASNKIEHLLPYAAGLGVSIIFGLSFLFTKTALDTFMPMELIAYRFAIAALVITLLVAIRAIKISFKGKPILPLVILSLFQPIIYFICETIGVQMTSSSQASMMIALIPIFVTILAFIFLGERPNIMQYIAIIVSVGGVVFILIFSGDFAPTGDIMGIMVLMGAVIAGAVYSILSKKHSKMFTPVEITFVMMWVGAIAFNLIFIGQQLLGLAPNQVNLSQISFISIMPLFYLGIISSIGAFFMFNYMISKIPASRASVFTNLVTVIAILAGIIFRHEAFYWYQMVGGVMIIGGVWGSNFFAEKIENSEPKA